MGPHDLHHNYISAMNGSRILEQHIAVFGESGSGKTVMLSSFFGTFQEPWYSKDEPFRVVADDPGQGNRLLKMYLDMRESAVPPGLTRFRSTSHAFTLQMKSTDPKKRAHRPFDAVRVVWHDYPGEWFEQGADGSEEERRRIDTFRSLLRSDVALLLVDAQKLRDNEGAEERYLKSLFGNLRNSLLSVKDDLLGGDERLPEFPRIWMLALSKADLLPGMDVIGFRDLIVRCALDELDDLRSILGELVDSATALSVGEDFLLLSSAKFSPDRIALTERIGLDLVLPIATVLPFERHSRWIQLRVVGANAIDSLTKPVLNIASALSGRATGPKVVAKPDATFARKLLLKPNPLVALLLQRAIAAAAKTAAILAHDKLHEMRSEALARQDYVAAVLRGFQASLAESESRTERPILLRSRQ